MIVYDVKYCDYCSSSIMAGQRWVREKIYDHDPASRAPNYHHFHAEPIAEQDMSCWEKHQMQRE